MSAALVPKAVSPFIRACRYGALITGVAYGHFHYNYLAKQEVEIQARENVIRDKINARKQAEKDASYHAQLRELEELTGSKIA